MPDKKKDLLRNILYFSSGKIYEALCAVLWTAVIARHLGLAGMGRYVFIWALLHLVVVFIDGGLNSVLVRELTADPPRAREHFGTVIWLRWTMFAFAGLVVLAIFALVSIPQEIRTCLLVGLVWLFAKMSQSSEFAVYLSHENLKVENFLTILEASLGIVLIITAVKSTTLGLAGIFLAQATAAVVASFAAMVITRRYFLRPSFTLRPELFRYYLKYSSFTGGSRFFRALYNKVDIFMLRKLAGEKATGIYGAPFGLVLRLNMVPFFLAKPLFPIFSWFAVNDRTKLGELYSRSTVILAGISLPIVILLISHADHLIALLFGEQFSASALPLRILSATLLFNFPNALFWFICLSVKDNPFLFYSLGITLLLNLILDVVLIPAYGVVGACYATLIAEGVFFVFAVTRFRTSHGFKTPWKKLCCLAVLATAFVLAFRFSLQFAAPYGRWSVVGSSFVLCIGLLLLIAKGLKPEVVALMAIVRSRPLSDLTQPPLETVPTLGTS